MSRGFWFNHHTGEFRDAIFETHFSLVVADPIGFGVTADFIRRTFAEQSVAVTGVVSARRQILLAVLENSTWTRWREMRPPDYYSHRWSIEARSQDRWNPQESSLQEILETWSGEPKSERDRFDLQFLANSSGDGPKLVLPW